MAPKSPILSTFVSPPEPPPKSEREISYEKKGLMSDQKKKAKEESESKENTEPGDEGQKPAIA